MLPKIVNVDYRVIDPSWCERMAPWGEKVIRHLHFDDGFTLVAMDQENIIGFISIYWRDLPAPLESTHEGYIDIIEVRPEYRRQGIAARLIDLSIQKARGHLAYQLRAWSSDDKTEAIPMWKELGFGLYPAVTTPKGEEIRGYFVTKVLEEAKRENLD